MIGKIFRKLLALGGFELRRINPSGMVISGKGKREKTPVLYDDMITALHHLRGGAEASFHCPLHACVHRSGLNFYRNAWHPLLETLREYEVDSRLDYDRSSLKRFYDHWQPDTAHLAIAGFTDAPVLFRSLPPHMYYLLPWVSANVEQMDRATRKWYQRDISEHGNTHLDMESHGFTDFGPVSDELGRKEFKRLTDIFNRIKKEGYNREKGDVGVMVLQRNDEYRYLVTGNGYHRMAAMTALGYEKIPASFYRLWILSARDVDCWPQVINGVWSHEAAFQYFNHLFDFDSRAWAEELGLASRV